jgi:hypothetical protein
MFSVADALLATQDYLRSGKSLAEFEVEHGIRGKTDGLHVILDYDQLSVKWTEPYGYVCRGLVLDAVTFDVIALGLRKFFNEGEHYADRIDWPTARVYEKIDGSMVNRWWSPHTKRFEYSTRFQLPGDIKVNTVNSGVITWQTLIDRCLQNVGWRQSDNSSPLDMQPEYETWTFEVCSVHNMVVVRHQDFSAKLLAIRNIRTLAEERIEDCGHGATIPYSYQFDDAAAVAEFANQYAATDLEGFVVVDGNFRRIKVKSDQYVQLHRAKDGLKGINNLIMLAKSNDYEEITVHFPEYKSDLDTAARIINDTIAQHEVVYEAHKAIEVQKDFAVAINKLGLAYTAALFTVRGGKAKSIRDAFNSMNDTSFCKLFKSQIKREMGDKYKEADDEAQA